MINIDIIAVGRMRDKAQAQLCESYLKRMNWRVNLHEINAKKPADIQAKIFDKLDDNAFIIALDENGKNLTSQELANKIRQTVDERTSHIQFVIGGADGHTELLLQNSHFSLSFGSQTWPHMLCRIMLIEQIYRAQQIISGHPYHRE